MSESDYLKFKITNNDQVLKKQNAFEALPKQFKKEHSNIYSYDIQPTILIITYEYQIQVCNHPKGMTMRY